MRLVSILKHWIKNMKFMTKCIIRIKWIYEIISYKFGNCPCRTEEKLHSIKHFLMINVMDVKVLITILDSVCIAVVIPWKILRVGLQVAVCSCFYETVKFGQWLSSHCTDCSVLQSLHSGNKSDGTLACLHLSRLVKWRGDQSWSFKEPREEEE